jgi:DNA-binding PadR family transcriptional regulator
MERSELESIMKTIDQQQHSSILGGMQAEYEELENLGYVKINWEEEHKLTAVITDKGREYVASLWH